MVKRAFFLVCVLTVAAPSARAADFKLSGDRYLREGQTHLAALEYEKALNDTPSTAVYFNLAIARFAQKDLPGAVSALEALVALDPRDAEALYNLGCLMLYRGEPVSGRDYFRKALQTADGSEIEPLAQDGLRFAESLEKLDPLRRRAVCHLLFQSLPSLRSDV